MTSKLYSFLYFRKTSAAWIRADSTNLPDSLSLSLSIHRYDPLLPVGLLNYVLCLHRADVNKVFLVCKQWQGHE